VKLGFRFVFFTLYPLKLHDTMMNAFLFNTGLILAGSLAVVQVFFISLPAFLIFVYYYSLLFYFLYLWPPFKHNPFSLKLCTISFSEYARFTSINGIFYAQVSNLQGVGYIFDFFSFAILGFALLTLIYLLVKPYDRKKEPQEKGKGKARESV